MPEASYNPQKIEPKWRRRWEETGVYKTSTDVSKPKYYVLEMLPYPSGTLHMGHVRNYSIGDALARYKRMQGFRVLHPMGWDSFGLPAENAAIKNKQDPGAWTRSNIAKMKRQLAGFSFSYDWDREISSCEPEFYRWNQWFFIRMWKKGLAYRKKSQVNWCPECGTVLANEQVVNGACWRHEDTPVELRDLEQWFFKTTAYADELLDDLDEIEDGWPERVITMQRNWIGRSEGTEVDFTLEGTDKKVRVFTTRVDTIFGATCVILAPEHPWVADFGLAEKAQPLIDAQKEKEADDLEKDGFFTGRYAVNPYGGEKVPIWVGNFVLWGYGTGAIMAVPRARSARLRVLPQVRHRRHPGHQAARRRAAARAGYDRSLRGIRRRRGLRPMERPLERRGQETDDRLRRREWLRPGSDHLSPARLGCLAPALLGHAHPHDPLLGVRHHARA